ncbi:MAG: divalent-cation tolerance protein CutA [Candidatus Micrarchaeia archaeon]
MILVLSTYPDRETAAKAAMDVVEKEYAACASMIKIEDSVYRWKGRIESGAEYLLLIKTTMKAYPKVEAHIKQTHPHKVPEIVFLEIKGGEKNYLEWVDKNSFSRLLRVPLDLTATRRVSEPSSELISARKPRTLSR